MSMPDTPRGFTYRRLRAALATMALRWRHELSLLIPERLRFWWQEAGQLIAVSLDDAQTVHLLRPTGKRIEEIGTIDLADPGAGARAARLIQDYKRQSGNDVQLMLCLAPVKVFQRTLSLPLAVEENLRQAVSFELDRFTPFKADQAQFDFRLRERSAGSKQLILDLLVAQRSVVEAVFANIDALQLPIAGVTTIDDIVAYGSDCRNLIPAGRRRTNPSGFRTRWRLAAISVAALLSLTVLAVPLWQKRASAIALLGPMYEAKHAADQTDVLRGRLDKLVETHNLLPDKKWSGHSTFRALEELSKRLPDTTFVIQLDFDGKTVQIQGETAASSELIELLDASPLFKDVGFKAQLTKIQGTTYDRFHITANLEATEKAALSIEPTAANAGKPASGNQ